MPSCVTYAAIQPLDARRPAFSKKRTDVTLAAVGIDDVPELHDRIIVATANHLGVPILTGDQIIASSQYVQTLW